MGKCNLNIDDLTVIELKHTEYDELKYVIDFNTLQVFIINEAIKTDHYIGHLRISEYRKKVSGIIGFIGCTSPSNRYIKLFADLYELHRKYQNYLFHKTVEEMLSE